MNNKMYSTLQIEQMSLLHTYSKSILILISAKKLDCRVEIIKPNDIAVVKSSNGYFLACVTKSKRMAGNFVCLQNPVQFMPLSTNGLSV